MNKIKAAGAALLVVISASATAQNKPKPPPKKASTESRWLQVPFDLSQEGKVSKPHSHEITDFFRPLSELPVKNTFETEAQFEERLSAARSRKVVGTVSLNDLVSYWKLMPSVDEGDIGYTYNPERRELSYYVRPSGGSHDLCTVDSIAGDVKTEGSYVGQNAFGVKRRVSVERQFVFEVAVPCDLAPLEKATYQRQWQWTIPMEPDRARFGTFSVIMIGHFARPGLHVDKDKQTATINDPTDLTTTTAKFGIKPVAFWLIDADRNILHKGEIP